MQASAGATDSSSGGDALTSRDRLVGQIVDQVDRQGYFMAQVPTQPAQGVIDLRWAAQEASRVLGRRIQTYAAEAAASHLGQVTLIAVPVDARTTLDEILGAPRKAQISA